MLADTSEAVQIVNAIFAGLGGLATIIVGFLMWRLRQGQIVAAVKVDAVKAAADDVKDTLAAHTTIAAAKMDAIADGVSHVKLQTNGMVEEMVNAGVIRGRTEQKADDAAGKQSS